MIISDFDRYYITTFDFECLLVKLGETVLQDRQAPLPSRSSLYDHCRNLSGTFVPPGVVVVGWQVMVPQTPGALEDFDSFTSSFEHGLSYASKS